MERALASKRDWWQQQHQRKEVQLDELPLDDRLRHLLQECVASIRENEEAPWSDIFETAEQLEEPLALCEDEPGVVLAEALATVATPSRLLALFESLSKKTRDVIIQQWTRLVDEVPLATTPPANDFVAAARAYASFRARALATCLEEQFIEGGNDPCSRGDLYLTRHDRYFYNFSYLCGEFGLGRDEAIASLRALAKIIDPTDEQLDRLGGREVFSALIDSLLTLDGDSVPHALAELLPLVELPFTEITAELPQGLVSRIAVKAVALRLGFELDTRQLLEIYEILTVLEAAEHDRDIFQLFIHNVFGFQPDPDTEGPVPTTEWQDHWLSVRKKLGEKRLRKLVLGLAEVYSKFSTMTGTEPYYRITAGWQTASLADKEAAEWVVRMTTEHGERSPILGASLLHPHMPPKALGLLAKAWKKRVADVPTGSSWSREYTVLVLRYYITRQRQWILDRLTDLYLRGGGYEAGETKEIIDTILTKLLDEMILTEEEEQRVEESELHFELLPPDINIFTGEQVDSSRWASPTSAYKYVRTLLRLDDRGLDYLASLVSERRVVALEKALRRLDFQTSVQQIVSCVQAFEDRPEAALTVMLLLRDSEGERPSPEWLEQATDLLLSLGEEDACKLLWKLYDDDTGDEYSLNPGLFWALRLVPKPQSISKLAKAATEMVRRKPSFAIAALDTLDNVGTRGALSAILQMRRRIRNRKVVKLINRTIDRIADEEGLDRDVFLDYAVDTGELERDGSRLFDFGSHQVTLRLELDGRISTTVLDAKGRHLRSFPKTAKDADPALYKEFQATKKLLVETLSYQLRRLEQSMINGRAWKGKDFLEIFREHPVMSYVARRLLWAQLDKKGKPKAAFLPTLDGYDTLKKRKKIRVSDEDRIVAVHPLWVPEEDRKEWQEILAERDIEQPFAQVHREVYNPLESEVNTGEVQRLMGITTASKELYRVVKERSWSTDGGGPWEVGSATHSYRVYPAPGQTAHLDTDVLGYDKKLTILKIRFTPDEDEETELNINNVHPVAYSEAFRDLYLCFEENKKKKKKKSRRKKKKKK